MMKRYIFIRLLNVLFFNLVVFFYLGAQELPEPVYISKEIGDTIDVIERDNYWFFPEIKNFHSAVFYMNKSGVLDVKILYYYNDALRERQIKDYTSLNNFNNYFKQNSFKPGEKYFPLNPEVQFKIDDEKEISGYFLDKSGDTIIMKENEGGIVILCNNKFNIDMKVLSREIIPDASGTDPNETSTFFLPTAKTLKKGRGYYGNYEIFYFTGGYATSDNVMLNGGIGIGYPFGFINLGPKINIYSKDNSDVAVGSQFVFAFVGGEKNFSTFGGVFCYGVYTYGNVDYKINFLAGGIGLLNFTRNVGKGFPFGSITGEARLSKNIKLIGEVIPPMIGIRFLGEKVSGDLGVLLTAVVGRIIWRF